MHAVMRTFAFVFVLAGLSVGAANAQGAPQGGGQHFSSNEILDAGHKFFGSVSRGLAQIVEKAGSQWGLPNGYVLGEEAGGAFIGGLRYGEGMLYTKNAGDLKVYWQGPSIGWDAGDALLIVIGERAHINPKQLETQGVRDCFGSLPLIL